MHDYAHLQTVVPSRTSAERRLLSLSRPVSRSAPPTIRATAIVFEDPASQAFRADLDRLAPSEASLVIIGETGTGKELVARYVHENSTRKAGPFVAVNCGALVDSLVEAELFGYEKGAFTGAIRDQVGWFEAANGGTLLLDEIGDLPAALQVKLLRVLQEREVVRLGARNPIPVDVRVIAATNIDLEAAVAAGQFRQDLFFRLNVATVRLPPLRERPGDIPSLASHFLELYRSRMERPELVVSDAALVALTAYAWPGNIRELENVIHNAVLLAPGPAIEPSDLKLVRDASMPAANGAVSPVDGLRAAVERLLVTGERDLFQRVTGLLVTAAFEMSERNQVRAAERLGLSRNAMRTQLARLGIISGRAPRRREAGATDPAQLPAREAPPR
jgi:transcriptional regulator with GAF, ATPase, and Fis domain